MAPRRKKAADTTTRRASTPPLDVVVPPGGASTARDLGWHLDLKIPTLPERLRARRPSDLVDVTFRFHNLILGRDGKRLVLKREGARTARLILVLPPQHIAEEAYLEEVATGSVPAKDLENRPGPKPPGAKLPGEPQPPSTGAAVPTLIAGPSQLVFDVGDNEIDFTLAGLLDAAGRLPLVVGRNATPPDPKYLQAQANELTIDPARPRRAAIGLGADPGAGREAAPVTSLAQLRMNAAALEHRFGLEEAATWLIGQRVGEIDRSDLDDKVVGQAMEPATPADPFTAGVTGIELPFRLLLSPHAKGAFALRSAAPTGPGPVELWHARLGLRSGSVAGPVEEGPSRRRTVRAVWARDRDLLGPDAPLPEPFQKGSEPNKALRLSLNSNDRLMITHQSSDFSLSTAAGDPWTPQAIDVDRLFLSTLGGWLDSGVSWPTRPAGFELEEWRHQATLGRDHYVRVVRAGFLFPTGHRASFVKVTERRFHDEQQGNPAFLRQRFYLVVREPYRVIPSLGDEVEDRRNPFHNIRITTVVTPPLDAPVLHEKASGKTVFQPTLDGRPFAFGAMVTDAALNLVELSVPLLFVGQSANDDPSVVPGLVEFYSGKTDARTLEGRAFGQRMAFAPTKRSGDTELAVDRVRLAARLRTVPWDGVSSKFGPVLASATVAIPAVTQLTGASGSATVTWPKAYLDHGMDGSANGGEVFLELVTATPLSFEAKKERSGALVAPDLSIQGLSRAVGPIGVNPADFAKGDLNPADLFSSALGGAKLFGVVPLADLIEAAAGDVGQALAQAPTFLTEALTKAAGLHRDAQELDAALAGVSGLMATAVGEGAASIEAQLTAALTSPAAADAVAIASAVTAVVGNQKELATELESLDFGHRRRILGPLARIAAVGADADDLAADVVRWVQGINAPASIRTRVAWHPKVKNWGTILTFADVDKALTLAIDLANPPGSSTPLVDVSCSIEGATVDLDVVKLNVDLIRFTVRGGQKPDIEVKFADPGVEFAGPLAFVETLRSLIPLDGFSDPPSVDVGPDGLKAGFSLALPNLAVGIFSLENLSLNASLDVPFIGEALSFNFSFCTRENPFHLIVSLFGGGGFVGIELTPKGIRMIEAALEFGAAVSLDFGVARGSLTVMAGIYFRYEKDKGLLVSGYFRARGEVDVLGLISASIELTISLTWQEPNKVVGRATLIVEVEVLFFSASVSIECEKRFSGSGQDPTFAEVMGPTDQDDPWREYCQAFVGV